MTDNAAIISRLKMLINAQVTDDAWLSAVNEVTGLDVTVLTVDYWNRILGKNEMGTVEEVILPDERGIAWNRPDGGVAMAVMDKTPHYVTLARFLMLIDVIQAMKIDGELSFVAVGYPPEWNRCTVYYNGSPFDGVIAADALLGTIEYFAKDKHGKLIANEAGDEFETTKISGIVKIVVEKQVKTFF